jgi:hypothetical protein
MRYQIDNAKTYRVIQMVTMLFTTGLLDETDFVMITATMKMILKIINPLIAVSLILIGSEL